jgi:hypothetical protein
MERTAYGRAGRAYGSSDCSPQQSLGERDETSWSRCLLVHNEHIAPRTVSRATALARRRSRVTAPFRSFRLLSDARHRDWDSLRRGAALRMVFARVEVAESSRLETSRPALMLSFDGIDE